MNTQKKEGKLILGGYVVPDFYIPMIYSSPGWYFASPYDVYRVQDYLDTFLQYLQTQFPLRDRARGYTMRWTMEPIHELLLQLQGDMYVDFPQAVAHKDQFKTALEQFVGKQVYEVSENENIRSRERQVERAIKLKNNITTAWKYSPERIEAAITNLVQKRGISRREAFTEVVGRGENFNVTAQGVGQAYGPWLNGQPIQQENNNVANNTYYN